MLGGGGGGEGGDKCREVMGKGGLLLCSVTVVKVCVCVGGGGGMGVQSSSLIH